MRLSVAGWFALGVLGLGIQNVEAAPRLGVALLGPDTLACATFLGDPRKPGDLVYLFLFLPPRVVDGRIQARLADPCHANADAESQSYMVRLRHPISDEPSVGIVLFDPTARVEYVEGEFIVNTVGATSPLRLRQCSSTEGLHMSAWRANRRTWHQYWYLGMDLVPTCTGDEAR